MAGLGHSVATDWKKLAQALVAQGHSPLAVAAALKQIKEDIRDDPY